MGRSRRRVETYGDRPLVNAIAATSFVIGGSLFAIGAGLAQADVGGPLLPASDAERRRLVDDLTAGGVKLPENIANGAAL